MASRRQSNTVTHRAPSSSRAGGLVSQWFADAEQRVKDGKPLDAHEIARLLHLLDPGFFKVFTRARYYCNYVQQDVEEYTLTRAFDTLDAARWYAHSLVQDGCAGRIERHREWKNVLYDEKWHRDTYDPDAIEIIEHFSKT